MLIQEARPQSGPKELRVKIDVEYHLKLHALKLLRGKRMSEAVEEALQFYFERVRLEQEAADKAGATLTPQIHVLPSDKDDEEQPSFQP